MIVNGHLLVARILYDYCKKELNFKLDKGAFLLGNIKPDFYCKEINEEHSYLKSIKSFVSFSEELLKNKKSIKDFSVGLGILCHFICDYFCLYHQKEYKKRNLIEHTLYEIALYFMLLKKCLLNKINMKNNYYLLSKNIPSAIFANLNKYLNERKSFIKDIDYALSTSAYVVKYIILNSQILESFEEDLYELPNVSGGIV